MPTDRSGVVILATLFFSCQAQIPLFRHPPCLLILPRKHKTHLPVSLAVGSELAET